MSLSPFTCLLDYHSRAEIFICSWMDFWNLELYLPQVGGSLGIWARKQESSWIFLPPHSPSGFIDLPSFFSSEEPSHTQGSLILADKDPSCPLLRIRGKLAETRILGFSSLQVPAKLLCGIKIAYLYSTSHRFRKGLFI